MTDANGWPIHVGSLVRVERAGQRAWRGWVLELTQDSQGRDAVKVREERRGHVRHALAFEASVLRPSDLQRARAVGIDRTMQHVSEQSKRARRL